MFPAGKKVLFLKRSGGQYEGEWWPVAGTSKVGEQPVQTALRELHEETALKAEHLFDFGLEIPHLNNTKALSAFVALVDKTSLVTLNFEHSQFRWMDGKEALSSVPKKSEVYLEHLCKSFIDTSPIKDVEIYMGKETVGLMDLDL